MEWTGYALIECYGTTRPPAVRANAFCKTAHMLLSTNILRCSLVCFPIPLAVGSRMEVRWGPCLDVHRFTLGSSTSQANCSKLATKIIFDNIAQLCVNCHLNHTYLCAYTIIPPTCRFYIVEGNSKILQCRREFKKTTKYFGWKLCQRRSEKVGRYCWQQWSHLREYGLNGRKNWSDQSNKKWVKRRDDVLPKKQSHYSCQITV